MAITDPLVLPADLLLIPVAELAADVRAQFRSDDGDVALTRPLARTPSKIVSAEAAELLAQFHSPKMIAQAVLDHSRACGADPEETLEEAFPLIHGLLQAGLLVPPESETAGRILPLFKPGEMLAGSEVKQCLQVLESPVDRPDRRFRESQGQEQPGLFGALLDSQRVQQGGEKHRRGQEKEAQTQEQLSEIHRSGAGPERFLLDG